MRAADCCCQDYDIQAISDRFMWKNSNNHYGVVSKLLHWMIALTVIALFTLGLWMVDLDYYHSWYNRAPDIHRSIGVLLMIAMLLRLLWLLYADKPKPLASHQRWEVVLAKITHLLLYLLIFAIGVTGYLISTADGRAVEVFDWFSLPSSGEWVEDQEDVAGEVHELLAFTLIFLAVIHAVAALKHHFFDKDSTLKRMM